METRITRILVPVDFSSQSEEAVRYAASLARMANARVEMVHVVQDPFMAMVSSPEAYIPDVTELLNSLTERATSLLEQLKVKELTGVSTESIVLHGEPSRRIVDYAVDWGADLIVMGTHGRTGLSHVVLGSVAERVVRHAQCPVLTVRGTAAAAVAQHAA